MNTLIASSEGQFVKAFPLMEGERVYGWHKKFGLIRADDTQARTDALKRKGALVREDEWICRFKIQSNASAPVLTPVDGCKINRDLAGWTIETPKHTWQVATNAEGLKSAVVATQDDDKQIKFLMLLAFVLFAIAVSLLAFWSPETVVKPEEIIEEQLTVVIKPIRTVTVSNVMANNPQVVAQKSARAVPQELGFLGLVGKKDNSKAVGGAQVNLNASAGAGRGGNAGSGGEMLAGLGKGVRATTVGNSGVQGLGGVGTKGKGGGLGGYGDVAIASGSGRGISAIGIGNGVGVDGGLDSHVIQATIAKYISQVRACYEERLRHNAELAGTLVMDFEIGPAGRLNFSKVKSSTLADPQVGGCVSKRMMNWEFPKPRGGVNVKVNYPFTLRPVGQ
jgi:hypothetical protein